MQIKEIKAYKCPVCERVCESPSTIERCYEQHLKEVEINRDFDNGFTLGELQEKYDFWKWRGEISEEQKKADKNSYFVIEYLQLCRKPIYKIEYIKHDGSIRVGGSDEDDYFSSYEKIRSIGKPYSKKEF